MRWTNAQATWMGTNLEKRGRWHGIPIVVRGFTVKGATLRGWIVMIVAALLLLAIVMIKDVLF